MTAAVSKTRPGHKYFMAFKCSNKLDLKRKCKRKKIKDTYIFVFEARKPLNCVICFVCKSNARLSDFQTPKVILWFKPRPSLSLTLSWSWNWCWCWCSEFGVPVSFQCLIL